MVYGDRNTFGGIQEMLQRFAIYRLGGNDDERIVQVAEALFYDDIDRSQRAIPRTRKAIIFDRWVIQQQDDPSVDEVLRFFEEEGLEYVSSWPRIDFAGRGTSTHSDPRNHDDIRLGAQLVETLWMMLNNGQRENILSCDVLVESGSFYERLSSLGSLLRNFQISSSLTAEALISEIEDLDKILRPSNTGLASRLSIFLRRFPTLLN